MLQRALITPLTSIFTVLLLASCSNYILKTLGATEKETPLRYMTNGEKQIAYFPIHHIGTREFYDDTRNKLDSLMNLGYKIYYEGVRIGIENDSLKIDTVYRKARYISSVDFVAARSSKGYIDTAKGTLMGKKINAISKYKLMNQPKDLFSKYDQAMVSNVDATFNELINECEKKFGPIVLEQYDFDTKFGEKYKFKKKSELKTYFLLTIRNGIISNRVLNDKHDKIILAYGGAHFEGILENLKAKDSRYREVEK